MKHGLRKQIRCFALKSELCEVTKCTRILIKIPKIFFPVIYKLWISQNCSLANPFKIPKRKANKRNTNTYKFGWFLSKFAAFCQHLWIKEFNFLLLFIYSLRGWFSKKISFWICEQLPPKNLKVSNRRNLFENHGFTGDPSH